MKRALIVIVLLSATVMCFAGWQAGLGADFSGKHKYKSSWSGGSSTNTYDVDMGIGLYGEYLMANGPFLYGLGAEYQIQRTVDFGGGEGKMGFIPIYLAGKYTYPMGGFTPEGIIHLGYNLFTADDDYKGDADMSGGIYWGIGAGVEVNNFVVQLMYKVNAGHMEQEIMGSTIEGDVSNSQINLSVGYRP